MNQLVSNSRVIAHFVADNARARTPAAGGARRRPVVPGRLGRRRASARQDEGAAQIVRKTARGLAKRRARRPCCSAAQAQRRRGGALQRHARALPRFRRHLRQGHHAHQRPACGPRRSRSAKRSARAKHEMLCAFVTGFEVGGAGRLGPGRSGDGARLARHRRVRPARRRRGGAALLKLDAERALHALGAAATQTSGLTASFGTMAKPFHAGKAAMDGVMSAQLAAAGFKAAADLLEPGGGLDNALVQDRSVQIAPADFSGWDILNNSFKPYAACHLTHPADRCGAGAASGPATSISREVRAIRAEVGALARPDHRRQERRAGDAARRQVRPEILRRAGAARAARCRPRISPTRCTATTRCAAPPARSCPGRDRAHGLHLGGGGGGAAGGATRRCAVPVAKGHPGNPMSWDDMRAKFEGLVEPVAGAPHLRDLRAPARVRPRFRTGGLATIRMLSAALQD